MSRDEPSLHVYSTRRAGIVRWTDPARMPVYSTQANGEMVA